MKCKHIEKIALAVSVIIIALIAGFPLLMPGIGGDIWDLNYHLLRIASVKGHWQVAYSRPGSILFILTGTGMVALYFILMCLWYCRRYCMAAVYPCLYLIRSFCCW